MYDVWKTKDNKIDIDGNGSRKVRVAIYCRVSTQHEEQIKALENQIKWCNDILPSHPSWELVSSKRFAQSRKRQNIAPIQAIEGFYIDEGLSALKTKNRPALNQLIEDCNNGQIDLILTREVCRFSRNILDAISIQRKLRARKIGVGIYFYQDNIFTYDNDAEMKLGIYATLAQNESQKVSERVRAGQETSRSKNILYGNGNILGYDLIKTEYNSNCYKINPEQANTVKRIFELCSKEFGIMKIISVLIEEGRLNSSGTCKWDYQNVQRILKNKTYCGYVSYNCTIIDECLDSKRYNTNYSDRVFKKVSPNIVPPIISEELFEECQRGLEKRQIYKEAKTEKNGRKKASKDIFARKMTCSCGSGFKKFKWNTTSEGKTRYGYTCYNVINHHSKSYYADNNIDTSDLHLCDMASFSDLKMRIQAKMIFENLINFDNLYFETFKKVEQKYNSNLENIKEHINSLEQQKIDIQKKQYFLTEKYADGKISDEIYSKIINDLNQSIEDLQKNINNAKDKMENLKSPEINLKMISDTLKSVLDFSIDINDEFIDRFVYQITVKSPTEFIWKLHFKEINDENPQFVNLIDLTADVEYAKKYSTDNHRLFKKSLWGPIDIKVMVAV